MDICYYCGTCYDRMPVFIIGHCQAKAAKKTGKPALIHVCTGHWDAQSQRWVSSVRCKNRAQTDGYVQSKI